MCIHSFRLKRYGISSTFSIRLASTSKGTASNVYINVDRNKVLIKRIDLFPNDVAIGLKDYGKFFSYLEQKVYNKWPGLMKNQHSIKKVYVDQAFYVSNFCRYLIKCFLPLGQKNYWKDFLKLITMLSILSAFPILNFVLFGPKDRNRLQIELDNEVLNQSLLKSWELIHERRGVDPVPPCPWIKHDESPPSRWDSLKHLETFRLYRVLNKKTGILPF